MKLVLEHPDTGIVKKAPVGINWSMIIFGPIPVLLRGDIKGFIIQAILDSVFVIPILIFPFTYNKSYIRNLLMMGFRVKEVAGGNLADAKAKLGINLKTVEE